jgi:hypothetical protein
MDRKLDLSEALRSSPGGPSGPPFFVLRDHGLTVTSRAMPDSRSQPFDVTTIDSE